jgi:hypothetical protein
MKMRHLPVRGIVDRRHLIGGNGRDAERNCAADFIVHAATVDQVSHRPIVHREADVSPVAQRQFEQLFENVAGALGLELQVHALADHRQRLGDPRRMTRHDAGRSPCVQHVQWRAAVTGDDAVTVECGLDDAVQARRAVEHARQVHDFVYAAGFLRPPVEGSRGFGVADVSAGRLQWTWRCR